MGLSRREALRRIAAAVFAAGAAGAMDRAAAQHVHAETKKLKGALGEYQRQFFTEEEWKAVARLAELIVPADGKSPSAADTGAPEFIDLLCSENEDLAAIYTGGLSWFDAVMRQRHGKTFIECSAGEQTALLDGLAADEADYRRRMARRAEPAGPYSRFRDYETGPRSELGAGVYFFDWVRKMAVDAYYTSPAGLEDLGYMGNGAYSQYEVPQESIDYALSRSPFAKRG